VLADERRSKIVELMREEGSVRVTHLSQVFGVSEVTIRQDLDKLQADGLITRRHGGAFLNTLPRQVERMALARTENMEAKAAIGKAAAALAADGQRLILDAGTTTTEVARKLAARDLTVITPSLNIALMLGSRPDVNVLVTGGEFKAPTLSLTGEKAAAFFEHVHVDTLFLATAGACPQAGLTYPGFADLPLKRAMVAAAGRVVLVADSTKLGKRSLARLGDMNLVQVLVTDQGLRDEDRKATEALGVQVIVAAPGQ
jgi:DeoR/GlpR family transcriptional regulator of sugar metabolism